MQQQQSWAFDGCSGCWRQPALSQHQLLTGASAAQRSNAAHLVREAAGQVADHRAVQPELLGQAGRWLHVRQRAIASHPAAAPACDTLSHVAMTTCWSVHISSSTSQIASWRKPSNMALRSRLQNHTCQPARRHQSWRLLLQACWCNPAEPGTTSVIGLPAPQQQRRFGHALLWLISCYDAVLPSTCNGGPT